jgi:hypothetical protein
MRSILVVSLTMLALAGCGAESSSPSEQLAADIASYKVMQAPMFVALDRVECPADAQFPEHDAGGENFATQDYLGSMIGRRYTHEKGGESSQGHIDTVYCYQQVAGSKYNR